MTRLLHWTRLGLAPVVLAVVVWRLGTGPFVDGVRAVDGRSLLIASAIGLLTTLCCAWRWRIVADGLGVRLSLRAAVAYYYRSLFLNLTLPGGIAGDVHRSVRHGREAHDLGGAVRAVVWERAAGQAVQLVLTVAVLLALPSPVRSAVPLALAAAAVAAAVLAAALRGRLRRRVAADLRAGLLRRKALPAVVLASAVVVVGHAVTFLVAAHTAGVGASTTTMLPLAFFAMLAMVLPSVAGWGPREGATAWVFGAAGLGADRGAATGVAYGVMVLVASLPGVIVLLAGTLGHPERTRLA
ncbi:MAG TPA: lysylphosphatidylglycerol synthase transmembrane domain-containing protein [Gaiellaceae bacterium]|nr:lysylphosphatidylglycerol synthase transmembrane domain-containing protein [Gaiellaceae bacterium]